MKGFGKREIALLLAIIGTCLFYKELIGINILIFTTLSALWLSYLHYKSGIQKLVLATFPALLSAAFLTIYPQGITYTMWVLSYIIMWTTVSVSLKPLLIPFQGVVSIFLSPVNSLVEQATANRDIPNEKKKGGNTIIYIASGVIIMVFALLYINSNPVISGVLSKLNLSFIEVGFILMLLGLFIFLYGLIKLRITTSLEEFNQMPFTLKKEETSTAQDKEFKVAKLSIWALGILLAIVNIADLLVILTGLPDGVTRSEYVHQGFNTLLFTLTLSIALIIFFFRGNMNFHQHISKVRSASFFWMAQNILLALFTAYKNILYVEVYGLTYKRVAVFLGLICVIIGLILSLRKIKNPSSNWFYFNELGKYAYLSFLVISLLPFDLLITRYNLKYSQTVDIDYIMSLDKPDLFTLEEFTASSRSYDHYNYPVKNKIQYKANQIHSLNWPSWNWYDIQYVDRKSTSEE